MKYDNDVEPEYVEEIKPSMHKLLEENKSYGR